MFRPSAPGLGRVSSDDRIFVIDPSASSPYGLNELPFGRSYMDSAALARADPPACLRAPMAISIT